METFAKSFVIADGIMSRWSKSAFHITLSDKTNIVVWLFLLNVVYIDALVKAVVLQAYILVFRVYGVHWLNVVKVSERDGHLRPVLIGVCGHVAVINIQVC